MSIFPARTDQEAQKKEQERDSQRRRRRRRRGRRTRRAGGTGFAPCFHRSFRSFRACFVSLFSFPKQTPEEEENKNKMSETLNKKSFWKKKDDRLKKLRQKKKRNRNRDIRNAGSSDPRFEEPEREKTSRCRFLPLD